ncbi:hypothetical protein ACE1CB_08145 [Aerosakkonema sp. BLCC-F2]
MDDPGINGMDINKIRPGLAENPEFAWVKNLTQCHVNQWLKENW